MPSDPTTPATRDQELSPAIPTALVAANAAATPRIDGIGSHRDILSLTWPVVLAQVLANSVNLIDILMLGALGTETLAAVGYATQFLFLIQATVMAIGSACVAMMARAIGSGELGRARQAFGATLMLSLATSFVLSGTCVAFPRTVLHLLDVPEPVVELAVPYFRLTLSSSVFMAAALTYEHAFRAARDTFRPMLVAAIASAVKLGLNFVLIFGMFGAPAMHLQGAGIATLVSQAVFLSIFFWLGLKHGSPALRVRLSDLWPTRARISEATTVALPAVAERVVMAVAIMTYFRFLGQYGVAAVAAYNVGVRILAFTWIPGIGLSVAAATLVGQALGAGDSRSARRAGWRATWLGLAISVLLAAVFVFLRLPMARVFTDDADVIAALDPFILVLGVALPFLVLHFTLAGALRGAGDTVTPMWAAALGNWLFRVPLGYLAAHVLHVDLIWLWSIMLIDHVARAVWLLWAYHFGRWDLRVGADVRPGR